MGLLTNFESPASFAAAGPITQSMDELTYMQECRQLDVERQRETIRCSRWERWRKTVVMPAAVVLAATAHEWLPALARAIF